MGTPFHVVIPARYASTRFPAKLLADLGGKPVLHWTCESAADCGAERVLVATDDERIASVVNEIGVEVCMTASHHESGTERLAEVVSLMDWPDDAIVVNLQGDEPLMPGSLIRQVADSLETHEQAHLSTLSTPITHLDELRDPAVVKVVTDSDGYALMFSRAAIPWDRDEAGAGVGLNQADHHYQRHLGIYAYRADFLKAYCQLKPVWIEQMEKLEQLRALWHGYRISVEVAEALPGHGIDTPADLEKVKKILLEQ